MLCDIHGDPSEHSSIAPALRVRGLTVAVHREKADWWWECHDKSITGLERKSIPDLCSSIGDGSLADELRRLVIAVDNPFLLIEGNLAPGKDGHIWHNRRRLSYLYSSIISQVYVFERQLGVQLITSSSLIETPNVLYYLYEQDRQALHRSIYAVRKSRRKLPSVSEIALSSIVGPSIALKMLSHFGGLRQVLAATYEELVKIPGVGPIIANKVLGV